jgi:5'-phosphate synthase pdxT subunit
VTAVKLGVLGLQGAVSEHLESLNKVFKELNVQGEAVIVKKQNQLDGLKGLIIPGGESTVIGRLANLTGLINKIREIALAGFPLFGTCAGMIFLAKEVYDAKIGKTEQPVLNLMDIRVIRNIFGRQRESFEADIEIPFLGQKPYRAVFIRAPAVDKLLSSQVEVLAKYEDKIVAVRQRNMLATAFHPELTEDLRFHKKFVELALNRG